MVLPYINMRKHLLISCLQSSFVVILEPPEIKSLSLSIVSPSIYHEVMIWIYLMWIYLPSAIRETPKNESESHSVLSDSVRPHKRQPTRLPRPWDSPGKNTGVGCHFLLWCMKVKSESEVAQSCPTPSDPMDCSLPGSSVHGIFQARVPEWGAIAFSEYAV